MASPDPSSKELEVHVPVLLREVLDGLAVRPGSVVLDGTLGAGGHAEAILERSAPAGILLGADRDPQILEMAKSRLSRFGDRARLFHSKISELAALVQGQGLDPLDGVLLDLGVSSWQLDQSARGFSFAQDGPLDMRMDPSEDCWTAADVVNRLTERELADLIYQNGDERHSRKIARAIVERRKKIPFQRTADLAGLIAGLLGQREKIHPATRTFQALRIAVNRELEEIQTALPQLLSCLKQGGRAAVISFHSLEDRIVKEAFKSAHKSGAFRLLVKKPMVASQEEQARNRRSRSAKLRLIERCA